MNAQNAPHMNPLNPAPHMNPMHPAPHMNPLNPVPPQAPVSSPQASVPQPAPGPVFRAAPAWTPEPSRHPVQLPSPAQELAGPFIREYRPAWPYRHSSAQIAAVLYYRHRRPRVVRPEGEEGPLPRRVLSAWLLRWLPRPLAALELQLGWHTVAFEAQLPAAESGRSFPTAIRVRWQVNDPFLVARSQVSDVAALLVPELEQRLRDVSRGYSIRRAEEVRDAVHAALDGHDLGTRFGLELDVFVTISSDKLIQDHGENLGRDEGKRELIRIWTREFQHAMDGGDHTVMAQMMARNPEDLQDIRQMFRKEQREERQDVMELMSRLIDGGLLERWELGDQAMVVVEFLRSGMRRVTADPRPQVANGSTPRRSLFWEQEDGADDTGSSGTTTDGSDGTGVQGGQGGHGGSGA
ncbi:hypothetical protein JCM4814A_05180 [Streptomyces phaeofaciens JCM 4814]|uniref:Band 7 domain-containing protein n=1 Tax=Streptomyces phaeofaciens TaxID=68254 RepID=A0A918HDE6_9ACTN|nr:hypothetical protein [Streptomyces phaeofaciens]GGT55224.1 hypothetical protein GCM10010226_35330 [Streptomyces phaeofaciens]